MSTIRLTTIAIALVSGTCLLAAGCGGGAPAGGNTAGTGPGGDTGGDAGPGTGGVAGTSSTTAGAGGTTGTAGATGGTAGTGGGAAGTGGSTAGAGAAGAGGRGGTTGGGTAGTAGGGRGGSGGTTGGRGGAAGGGGGGATGTGGSGGSPAGTPTIFYLDVGGEVMTAAAENPMPRTLVASAGQGPDGIAIDLAAGHLFWTGMGNPSADDGFVRRSNIDGTNVVTLVPAGGTYTPKQMRVDPAGSRKLYWSDREGMQVQRSNVDGSGVETLVTTGTTATDRMDQSRWCVGMAIDTAGGWFYWTQKGGDNAGVGSIRRAHIQMPAGQTSTNRNDIEILFSGLPEPIDLELDVAGGMIYWADRGDDTINRAPIAISAGSTAANRADRQILVRQVREAIGVAIDKRRGRLYYTAANGQLGRANLDGSNKMELTGAGALTGIVVVDLP